MMMTSVRRSRTSGMHTLTHLWKKGSFSWFRLAERQWLGIRRKDRESVQHHTCCFGINHGIRVSSHHLYVIDVISEDNQPQELVPCEIEDKEGDEIVQNSNARVVLQRKKPHYYNKQQQLELVLAAQ